MTEEEAFSYAAALCNKAEYCRAEIAEKLRRRSTEASDIDAVLEKLERQRLVDDRRYARAFTRQKFRNQHWGRRKIEMELRRKKIAADTITEALGEISVREYILAIREILIKKLGDRAESPDRAALTAVARYAIGRGFEPSMVFDMIRQITLKS